MKFRQLAIKNVIGNRHQYSAFFLSSTFSIMIFFIFSAFIFHPDVIHGEIMGGSGVRIGMMICEYIIFIFSFFFVLYSLSAFLKARKKEFGLLFLFGFTKSQLRRLVIYENMLICLTSSAAGIGLGILFSKLFFMAISHIMKVSNPIGFYIPVKAAFITGGGYLILFLLITVLSMRRVGRDEIVQLMQASKQPKTMPHASRWLVLLCAACLGAGYVLAYMMDVRSMIITMQPIVILVIIGTYFLFTQLSVAVMNLLKKRKSIHYHSTNMIVISQMAHKIKDNARVLFLVTLLCAVILTASSTINVFFSGNRQQLIDHQPQTIAFVEKGLNSHDVIDPDQVKRIIHQHHLTLDYELKLVGVTAEMTFPKTGKEEKVMLISETDYNMQAARMEGIEPVALSKGSTYIVHPYKESFMSFGSKGDRVALKAAGEPMQLEFEGERSGMITKAYGPSTYLAVLNNDQYEAIASKTRDTDKVVVYGYEIKEWESASAFEAAKQIINLVPENKRALIDLRTDSYYAIKQMTALTMFIAIFISVLFFMASGSLLFFKMFTEIQEDQAQFRALNRIGLTTGELKKIVTSQIGILFYVPCVVGAIHAAFAMKALSNILFFNVWTYAGIVLLVYLAMQTVYFLVARHTYLKKIIQGATV
ncbi:ABC transporter permease [Paenibacillus sediminis]|uniref:ABC transport system permease protein n=1 Tax=Paenibacillus sediminis TaxID=664909 RepID=A0ABS4H3M3_9BACL|nr:ABC transporter permease [Paenibacillus sediminis]MBP1936987.1 putative ABC transport system permease protein [Paenibacillus sediminis]